jgi:hypothetical protein
LRSPGGGTEQASLVSLERFGRGGGDGEKTIVTCEPGGTHVRVEQSGFRPEDTANYQGANYGWQKYFAGLERVAARPE